MEFSELIAAVCDILILINIQPDNMSRIRILKFGHKKRYEKCLFMKCW